MKSEIDLWFQITVTYSVLMQHHQPLQDLSGNWDGVAFCNYPMLLHILAQIAMRNILHCQVNCVLVLIPTEETYETLRMLRLILG